MASEIDGEGETSGAGVVEVAAGGTATLGLAPANGVDCGKGVGCGDALGFDWEAAPGGDGLADCEGGGAGGPAGRS